MIIPANYIIGGLLSTNIDQELQNRAGLIKL